MTKSIRISTGSEVFDNLLEGGYECEVVTSIYGPAGSGKTTACLLAALSCAPNGKVIYIDTEGGFSPERFLQLADGNKKLLDKLFVLHPTNFPAQITCIDQLPRMMSNVALVICDTISALYRTERGEENSALNRELGRQLATLLEIARTKNIPVLLTNQVYSDFENKENVHMVGGDLIKYSSKCIIELSKLAQSNRRAALRKHRSLPEKEMIFHIEEKGFVVT